MTHAFRALPLLLAASSLALASSATAQTDSRSKRYTPSSPTLVVTVENAQAPRGTFLTPPWLAVHDGTFDSYDGGQPASVPLGGNEIEALAEDGNNGPITDTFDRLQPGAPQVSALPGPSGPLAPGDSASIALPVDPSVHRYFSYASMIIPSNDFFIANGNPLAHQVFDDNGVFVGDDFIVSGDETNDAGTEVNDEIASNVAFLAQAAPDTGVSEANPVATPAPGFAAPGTLTFPNGVLNHPVFGLGDFNDADDALFRVSFRFVDLARNVGLRARLSADQEVGADAVTSSATAVARLRSVRGNFVQLDATARDLSSPLVAAHLHLGAAGTNGPVIVDLGSGISGDSVWARIGPSDLTAAFDGDFQDFLVALVSGNVYLNLHTSEFPAGEVRGQVELNGNADRDTRRSTRRSNRR